MVCVCVCVYREKSIKTVVKNVILGINDRQHGKREKEK